jgi:steroid delta-isomerase-like uncharacterized protein
MSRKLGRHIVPAWPLSGSAAQVTYEPRRIAMSERNRRVARRYFEELLAGDIDLADEIVAEDVAFYGPDYWGEAIHGRDGFKGFVAYLRSAFPDLRFELADEVSDEERVATRFVLRMTHQGEWLGIPATGRALTLPGMDLFRIVDGQIAEVRVFYDTLGLMQQLGVIPNPAAAQVAV